MGFRSVSAIERSQPGRVGPVKADARQPGFSGGGKRLGIAGAQVEPGLSATPTDRAVHRFHRVWCLPVRTCRDGAHGRYPGAAVRLDAGGRSQGHKAIMRLFGRFDMLTNERVQAEACRWLFSKISALRQVTLDVDSTVVTRNGEQEGATRGYNPNRHGRASHHPLLAFVAEARMVANFWLRPGMSIAPTTSCNCSNRPCIIWATRSLGCHVPTAASSMKPSWRSWKVSASPTSLPPA